MIYCCVTAWSERMRERIMAFKFSTFLLRLFPLFDWIRHYYWKDDLLNDITAGLTVGVMHLPQGMSPFEHNGCTPYTTCTDTSKENCKKWGFRMPSSTAPSV